MSEQDDTAGWGFAPPPFVAEDALVALRRQLRDLRPLAERGARYALRGREVIRLEIADGAIDAQLAKRHAVTPEWTRERLANAAAVRKWLETVRRQVARWNDDGDGA